MNKLLQLKGRLHYEKNKVAGAGRRNLPKNAYVTTKHLIQLKLQLEEILRFWQNETLIEGALVTANYRSIVAKSNRLQGLLSKGIRTANDFIRGGKFSRTEPTKHIFTYYLSTEIIEESIDRLSACIDITQNHYNGNINDIDINEINTNKKNLNTKVIAKTNFVNVIVDSYYLESFTIDTTVPEINGDSLVTFYKTSSEPINILQKLGINILPTKTIGDTTVLLTPNQHSILKEKAPYLISMAVSDLKDFSLEDDIYTKNRNFITTIPKPENEPIIGVIDTPFSKDVYFSDWVTYHHKIDKSIEIESKDYNHGTQVSSLIVDGASINPELDDGCGRFRVRHFGVTPAGRFSSFSILKAIREIIPANPDIKVWNLSLGSNLEINPNFISPEAAEIDRMQNEYDVIFIISGTNKRNDDKSTMRIGAPADSLNSIVVNSVTIDNKPASYSRTGPVLSFFIKPDVAYFGGDAHCPLRLCSPLGEHKSSGTSYAAPWIARKAAFLINKLGFSREVAKALLLDAAAGWNNSAESPYTGFGIVPQKITDIINSQDDEIRFVMTGTTEEYETFTYNLPIPVINNKHPFIARALLCYFPKCDRNQGVDYTSTEMDLHFGRVIVSSDGKTSIKSINNNKQSEDGIQVIYEKDARKLFRKWDNVKRQNEILDKKHRPRIAYGSGLWGIRLVTKERLKPKNGVGMPFGLVITLKEMHGKNRIQDFINLCNNRGWLVNQIDIENRIDIYNRAEEEITLS